MGFDCVRDLVGLPPEILMVPLAAAALAAEAKAAIDAGRYDEADGVLLRARDQETAAAREAEQLAHEATGSREAVAARGGGGRQARRSGDDAAALR